MRGTRVRKQGEECADAFMVSSDGAGKGSESLCRSIMGLASHEGRRRERSVAWDAQNVPDVRKFIFLFISSLSSSPSEGCSTMECSLRSSMLNRRQKMTRILKVIRWNLGFSLMVCERRYLYIGLACADSQFWKGTTYPSVFFSTSAPSAPPLSKANQKAIPFRSYTEYVRPGAAPVSTTIIADSHSRTSVF